jgi:uncharacterized protein YcbX
MHLLPISMASAVYQDAPDGSRVACGLPPAFAGAGAARAKGSDAMSECTVAALTIYPVKGCQGVAVDEIEVRRGGIVGDREIMLVKDGKDFAQRDHPRLARVRVERLGDGRLRLSDPDAGEHVHEIRSRGDDVAVNLTFNDITTRDQGDAVAGWAAKAMGEGGIRVVSLPRPWDRWIPLPEFRLIDGRPQHQLYDVAPVLLNNQASLDDLNTRTASPVPMDRFRANVVVRGLAAYEEDQLKSLSSSAAELLYVTACERCIMTTTDQTTGERTSTEPIKTLSSYRKRENKYASGVVFGAYMTAGREGTLKVGDRLAVTMR